MGLEKPMCCSVIRDKEAETNLNYKISPFSAKFGKGACLLG